MAEPFHINGGERGFFHRFMKMLFLRFDLQYLGVTHQLNLRKGTYDIL